MELQVNVSGSAYWRCDTCQRILTWAEYDGTAVKPLIAGFTPSTASAATPATETHARQNSPTVCQKECLAHLANRAGEDMDSLMSN
eukprot:5877478-Heterocapsa_arctica.AAC.1